MKRSFAVVMALSAFVCAGSALAQSQLAADAGLTAEQAEGMSLNQIAAIKANRGVSVQDRQTVVVQQVPGSNPELVAFGFEKYNADQSASDKLFYRDPAKISGMAFQDPIDVSKHTQLIAAAGLTPEEAAGMSLNEIVHIISPD
ncbi:MAG TPA: hypothetical protein PLH75_01985 [Amaricoccus sp.]|uniref:hypothetical protein n=1 Tax=Amaricoccus sp. TaxID=1872485 RepID=UPI001D8FA95D|nr:hypothetical protein [Amaricoccus sp.]MCB1402622.1 hypothetical protein [Paracoccaceae bacterium]HPG21540.1 hypothetical protein [Amaricoccus sp.]HRW15933.1 hypothetical protein [Amaricoccus sp.]